MQHCVAAALKPLAVVFRVEVTDPQHALLLWIAGPIRFDVRHEADKRCLAFEDHVKLAKLVALHAVRLFWILLVPIHVLADAFYHRASIPQIPQPVLSVSRPQSGVVFIDKSLKDAFDVGLDRGAISRAVVLCASGNTGHQQSAQGKGKKGRYAQIHERILQEFWSLVSESLSM